MKNILKFLAFVAVALVFTACNDDDSSTDTYTAPNIARFLEESEMIETSEASTDVISIPVYINYRSAADVTVNYEVTGSLNAYQDMNAMPGKVVIPAGLRSGKIELKAVDNMDYNEVPNSIVIKISSADNGYVLPENTSTGFTSKTVTFIDNDCPPNDRDAFEGDISCEDVGYGSVPATGTLSGEDCSILIIAGNLPNSNAGLTPDFAFKLTEQGGGKGTIVCARQPYGSNFYEASGSYENGVIKVNYTYSRATGATIWTGTNIIKK